ncbi:uncharacterized protein [Panulirus ornatus]|uniref:uncharacterized protein n=1 Tax=Panulirus ornatus TaxID=150431 RepID=UPI003A87E4BF
MCMDVTQIRKKIDTFNKPSKYSFHLLLTSPLQNREQHQGDSYPKDAKKNPTADRKSEDSEVESPVDSLFSDIDKGIQVEVEKVKRRRSTICRGYMSSHSIGGRRSLSATFSLLSLEDQISKIDERLPWASKVSKLVDISIREALRRLEIHLPGNECVADLRMDLLTKFENLARQIAFKIVDYPKVLEAALPNTSSYAEEVKESTNRIRAYKKMTKELEQEYRNWKVLMKERKLACQTAERKYSEAKSGEKKIEDNQTNQLTSVQRNILSSHPNYHHYIQEIQMVCEKAVLMFQEVRLATNAVSCLITSSTLLAESCYASLEELSFGYLKKHPIKTSLTSLLQKSHTGTTKVCEP